MVISGSAADVEFKERQEEFNKAVGMVRRNWLIFLLAIYAIPVIITTIVALVDASNIANSIWVSDEFQKWITDHGYNYTKSDIQGFITTAAGLGLASGICATVSLVLVYKRRHWVIAVATCFIAAFLCFWSFFGIIIGILVGWMLVVSRDIFEDESQEPAESEAQ